MRRHQMALALDVPRVVQTARPGKLPPPTDDEKQAQRAQQDFKCATCGNPSKGGIALDVVRGKAGMLVAFCRRDRLRFDAVERCRKGAAKRPRGTRRRTKRNEGQRRMREVG